MSNINAQRYNDSCHCVSTEKANLFSSLESRIESETATRVADAFAAYPVFIDGSDVAEMQTLIQAVHKISADQAYVDWMLSDADPIASTPTNAAGAFISYDFHLTEVGPKLIEVNTNAGGGLLTAHATAAQAHNLGACCPVNGDSVTSMEDTWANMFEAEWRSERGGRPLRTIAIVDDEPNQQFLYPEFELAKQMLRVRGFEVDICDPAELSWSGSKLELRGKPIDLVYNRLTDFYLTSDQTQALRAAYLAGEVVLTPNPRHHALLANKRALTFWSNAELVSTTSLDTNSRETLARMVPITVPASDELWGERKSLFFKPLDGYASRGCYDGRKLTKARWADVVAGGYIAQERVNPSTRTVLRNGQSEILKADIRCLTYRGELQQISARLYRGQTTNLRTPGGGLTPVLPLPVH